MLSVMATRERAVQSMPYLPRWEGHAEVSVLFGVTVRDHGAVRLERSR
jgi:hypothetical protein